MRLLAILLAAFAFFSVERAAQAAPAPDSFPGCVYQLSPPTLDDLANSRLNCDITGALKVSGNITANNPSVSNTGSAVPSSGTYIAGNKSGTLTGLTLDGSSNLNVNCAVGCAGGSFNNNADAVATNATNGQSAAYLYAFNGVTFDRLRDDASKNLNVNVNAALPAGANLIGTVNPGTPASWSLGATAAAVPANAIYIGANKSGNLVAPLLDASGFLEVNVAAGGASGGTSSTFGAAFPGTGTAIGAKNGANMVNLTADGSNNLNVNCTVGCAGGTFNNNADAVATNAGNGQTAAYLYAFNGTTFDRLTDDASKNLNVKVNAALPAGTNVLGHIIVDSGTITAVTAITNALPAGTNVIGHVISDTGSTTAVTQATGTNLHMVVDSGTITSVTSITNALPAGSNVIGHVIADSGSTTAVTGATSNAASGIATGSVSVPSVAYNYFFNGTTWDQAQDDASKNLKVIVNAPIAAGTNVIGHVIVDSGTITAVTAITNALPAGTNVIGHIIADTGSTTAVTGTVAENLTQIAGSSVSAAATGIQKVGIVGNAGAAMDAAGANATAPANELLTGCLYQSTPAAITAANASQVQCDAKGNLRNVIMDAAGNARGANVDASNRLSVTVDAFTATNASVNEAQVNGVTPLMGNGVTGTGSQRVTVASDNTPFPVKIDQTTPGSTNGVSTVAATSGGTTLFTLTLANTTNATNVKASAGQVYSISGFNMSSATPVWISLYNTAGTPSCGTSIIQQFLIPGNTTGAGFVYDFATPKQFATGIGFCATTGIAGTGAPAATTYVLNVDYK